MKKVVITTSGTGERLGELTKYTNKSLVKVGDKYAICHIIESYEEPTEFIITLGYYGNLVRDFLEMAYPERKIEYVYIDNYVGEGSSLGYSLLKTRHLLQCPFIFHCCDSIVNASSPLEINPGVNTLYVSSSSSNSQYASIVKDDNNKVNQLNEKKCSLYDYVYIGISYIHDFAAFWDFLKKEYESNTSNQGLSDVHAIRLMMQNGVSFDYKITEKWYDTGNPVSYENLKQAFKPKYEVLEKNNESLCFLDTGFVIKFINDRVVNEKRVKRGNLLYPHTPKIHQSADHFIKMELVDGTVLSEVYSDGIIRSLLEWAEDKLWINKDTNLKYIDCCYRFYITKTLGRINDLPFLNNECDVINGLECPNIKTLIDRIPVEWITTDTFVNFHGDFILENIILSHSGSFKLIDWRHEFDDQITHGDVYYDLAKLRHNLILNHKNVNNGMFEVGFDKDHVKVDLKCNFFHVQQLEDFDRFVEERQYDANKIKMLTALIWLNMAPLYDGKFREFLFYFGKYNLYKILLQVRL